MVDHRHSKPSTVQTVNRTKPDKTVLLILFEP